MATPTRVYLLETRCNLESGGVSLNQTEITDSNQWRPLLDRLQKEVTPKYKYSRTPPTWKSSLTVQKVREDGSVALTAVRWCGDCGCHKVPGVRHQHDVRRCPQVGAVLSVDLGIKRWSDQDSPGWEYECAQASLSDPRWVAIPKWYTVKVLAVELEEAWSYEGVTYPAETTVKYKVTREGDWSLDTSDEMRSPDEGVETTSLEDWRSWASDMEIVSK